MNMAWQDLYAALALVLVVEGALPFIKPDTWRRAMSLMTQQPDNAVRIIGFATMIMGVTLLYLVR